AAFMLGWAGVSIHCQVLAFLADSGLSPGTYFAGKLLHGGVSAALVWVLSRVLPQGLPVSLVLADRVDAIAALDFPSALTASAVAAWCLFLAFLFFSIFCGKKRKQVV
ncbi:MAG: sporulation protein, partial [Oscillospiraceae bacterium]